MRNVFQQCVECVFWMHSKGVCLLDLSLENTQPNIHDFVTRERCVKFRDFELCRKFDVGSRFTCDMGEGRILYMAPEPYAEDVYDARKANVWSLGVMLFMMLVGVPPFGRASRSDNCFNAIIGGRLRGVLEVSKRLCLVSADALDLLEKIFKLEKERLTMEELL